MLSNESVEFLVSGPRVPKLGFLHPIYDVKKVQLTIKKDEKDKVKKDSLNVRYFT